MSRTGSREELLRNFEQQAIGSADLNANAEGRPSRDAASLA